MASSVKDMLAAANSAVPRIQPADLRDRMSKGDVVVVDVRDAPELATGGKIKGAVHVPRGMLEFRADPESPYHNPALRKEKTAVLYCASGGRSALAESVAHRVRYAGARCSAVYRGEAGSVSPPISSSARSRI
jgi:rhodanese-related sulfurtransferase